MASLDAPPPAEDFDSIRAEIRYQLLSSVLRHSSAKSWRTLVVDYHSMRILSSAVSMYDVLEQGIDIVETIEDETRAASPEKAALYFLSPCEESVKCIINDFSSKIPRYGDAQVFFTSSLSNQLLQNVALSPAAPFISVLREVNIEFLVPETRVFHFDSRELMRMYYAPSLGELKDPAINEVSRQLASFLICSNSKPSTIRYAPNLERVARMVASSVEKAETESTERTVLLLLDRFSDLITPIIHDFHYQSIIYDLVEESMKDNQVNQQYQSNDGQKRQREVVLDERDPIFRQSRHMFISDASDYVISASRKFAQEYGTDDKPGDLIKSKDFIRNFSKKQELTGRYSMHVDLVQSIADEFKSRGLNDICTLEQDIATGQTAQGKKLKFDHVWQQVQDILKEKPDGKKRRDIVRLLALVVMCDDFKPEQLDSLVNPAQLYPEEFAAMENFLRLKPKKEKASILKSLKKKIAAVSGIPAHHHAAASAVSYDLDRYNPAIKSWVQDLVDERLSESQFGKLNVAGGVADHRGLASSQQSASVTKATWANKRATSEDLSSSGPAGAPRPRKGTRYVVFVMGGVTYSEIRVAYEIAAASKVDVVIGSTHILTPSQFLADMRL